MIEFLRIIPIFGFFILFGLFIVAFLAVAAFILYTFLNRLMTWKKCPFCRYYIQPDSRACPHCTRDVV